MNTSKYTKLGVLVAGLMLGSTAFSAVIGGGGGGAFGDPANATTKFVVRAFVGAVAEIIPVGGGGTTLVDFGTFQPGHEGGQTLSTPICLYSDTVGGLQLSATENNGNAQSDGSASLVGRFHQDTISYTVFLMHPGDPPTATPVLALPLNGNLTAPVNISDGVLAPIANPCSANNSQHTADLMFTLNSNTTTEDQYLDVVTVTVTPDLTGVV